jgi:hypothetical protein
MIPHGESQVSQIGECAVEIVNVLEDKYTEALSLFRRIVPIQFIIASSTYLFLCGSFSLSS